MWASSLFITIKLRHNWRFFPQLWLLGTPRRYQSNKASMESDYCGTMALSRCFSRHLPEATSAWETNPSFSESPVEEECTPPSIGGMKEKMIFPFLTSLHDAAGIFPEVDVGQCNWYGMFWNIIKCSQEMQPTDTRALNVLPLLLKTESDNHVKSFYSTHTISLSLATGLLILHSL